MVPEMKTGGRPGLEDDECEVTGNARAVTEENISCRSLPAQ